MEVLAVGRLGLGFSVPTFSAQVSTACFDCQVLSYCRENLQWMNASFSRKVMPSVDVVVVAKCSDVDAAGAVPFRSLWRSVEQVDVEDLPLRADECSAYLGYYSKKYSFKATAASNC